MLQDPATIEPALDLILVSRHLERIGDHATNIAEDVIFMVSARDVRHHAGEPGRSRLPASGRQPRACAPQRHQIRIRRLHMVQPDPLCVVLPAPAGRSGVAAVLQRALQAAGSGALG